MTEGCVSPNAFLEIDDAGNRYVTLRLGLMDNINNVNILADDDWVNAYYQCSPQTIAVDGATTDFRFLVGSEGAIFRINMYVVPMGREVIFYVTLSGFSEGVNNGGFYVEGSSGSSTTATPSAGTVAGVTASTGSAVTASTAQSGVSSASSASQQLKAKIAEAEQLLKSSTKSDELNQALQTALDEAKAVQEKTDPADDELKAAADKLGDALTTFKNSVSAQSVAGSSDGIEEYDAGGNKVSQDDGASAASVNVPVSTLVVGGVLLVVIIAGLVWFFAYYRPRHVGGPSSAAAAAAAPAGGAFRPYEAGPAVLPEEGASANASASSSTSEQGR